MPHCARDTFTPEQYYLHEHSFWALPRSWASGTPSFLAQLWRAGRGGSAIGLLPLLGQFTHSHSPAGLYLSLQEMTRILAQAPNTVAKGARILEDPFALVTGLDRVPGEIARRWRIHPAMAAPRGPDQRYLECSYFSFPARWIYGGQWALLSDAERQVLLAVAAMSELHWEEPCSSHELADLPWTTDRSDLQASWECYEVPCEGGRRNAYRATVASASELATATALGRTSIAKVLGNWRQTGLQTPWGAHCDRVNRPILPERQLVRAYLLRTGHYLLHFRDHVSPWPFEELNARLRLVAAGTHRPARDRRPAIASGGVWQ